MDPQRGKPTRSLLLALHTISVIVGYAMTLIHSECGNERRSDGELGVVLTILCWDMFTESSGNLV